MNVRFTCPSCERPGRLDAPLPAEWVCPSCDQVLRLTRAADGPTLTACAVCGNGELYCKKDFPQALGMGILALSCLASSVTYWLYQKWWTWAILIGSAAFDGVLYALVRDVTVCYRCDAHYRDLPAGSERKAFELTTFERYRQEQMRRKQLAPRP